MSADTDFKSDQAPYYHTQKGPWHYLLYVLSGLCLCIAWTLRHDLAGVIILLVQSVLMYLLAQAFKWMVISDEVDHLLIRFGPIPLFRKKIFYRRIKSAERDRITWLDGWCGINYSLRGGWVWSIWGLDCVKIVHWDGKLRLGTDDPDGLLQVLQQHTTETSKGCNPS